MSSLRSKNSNQAVLESGLRNSESIAVETVKLGKTFGAFKALDEVSISIKAGSFHALLGENGAGKSTLVKCLMGYYKATSGEVLVNNKQQIIQDPRQAQSLGLGMVYQHFTLVPSLTGAENLVVSEPGGNPIINWRNATRKLNDFMRQMPFTVSLQRPVAQLAAGEKQKLEILKQLYLGSRFLILDEPTSVLTPDEADEVLAVVASLVKNTGLTVLMITHKFREVSSYADNVTVLRQGIVSGSGNAADLSHDDMAKMMMNSPTMLQCSADFKSSSDAVTHEQHRDCQHPTHSDRQLPTDQAPVLQVQNLNALDRSGYRQIQISDLQVFSGEIVGIAGISGNGQTELIELLSGQRRIRAGEILVDGHTFVPGRTLFKKHKVRFLPEEPLANACAQSMSVVDNISLRDFDSRPDGSPRFWLNPASNHNRARALAEEFDVKAASLLSPVSTLSGGNVQRAVLARELSGSVRLLIASNPCFGLDFAAVTEIRTRMLQVQSTGAAVLLISEDLDELLELSDRILVMSEGAINFECINTEHDRDRNVATIGHHMAGGRGSFSGSEKGNSKDDSQAFFGDVASNE